MKSKDNTRLTKKINEIRWKCTENQMNETKNKPKMERDERISNKKDCTMKTRRMGDKKQIESGLAEI